MHFQDLDSFLRDGAAALAKGPIALILLEDDVEVGSTIRHHLNAGSKSVVVLGVHDITLPADLPANVIHVGFDAAARDAAMKAVNAVID